MTASFFPASDRALLGAASVRCDPVPSILGPCCLRPAARGLNGRRRSRKSGIASRAPVAYAISLLGIVVTGAILVFGGEINEFVRRIIMLVLVISLMVFAADLFNTLFNKGAVIA